MNHFLLIYDRTAGRLLKLQEFPESGWDEALRQRNAFELEEREHPNIEVIVLSGASLEQVKSTHARYFKSLRELATVTP